MAAKVSKKASEDGDSAMGTIPHGGKEPSVLPSVRKSKAKSRPSNTSTQFTIADISKTLDDLKFEEEKPSPKIELPPDSARKLTRMFPSKVEEYGAKPMDWKSFVVAMEDAGYLATHSGGSAVTFKQTTGEGRIIFHKPHPVAKIDQTMFQCFGKRMRKWFGWERDTFVAKKKDSENEGA